MLIPNFPSLPDYHPIPIDYNQIIKNFDSFKAKDQTWGSVSKRLDDARFNTYPGKTRVQKAVNGLQEQAVVALFIATIPLLFAIVFGAVGGRFDSHEFKVISGTFGGITSVVVSVALVFGILAYQRYHQPFSPQDHEDLRDDILNLIDRSKKSRGEMAQRAKEYVEKLEADAKQLQENQHALSRSRELDNFS